MNVETLDDVCNKIADWVGVYGCCKGNGDVGCEFDTDKPLCCRVGFTGHLKERIEQAIENDKKLAAAGII